MWTGDLGLDDGVAQSVYTLDNSDATPVEDAEGKQVRLDLQPGETQQLPGGLGSVSFDGVQPWVRVQISQTPGKGVALGRRRARTDRVARLAVHPPAPGVGACPTWRG